MDLSALQGRALERTVNGLKSLLTYGEVAASSPRALTAPRDAGLWIDGGERLVATPELVTLANRLPNDTELLPAAFSLVPEVRASWLRIVLARLHEMGERHDIAALCDAVALAGPLTTELVNRVASSLTATSFGELERLVLPAAAHEAPAFPCSSVAWRQPRQCPLRQRHRQAPSPL